MSMPFSIAHAQSNFRLLELPDELLQLLTAPNPVPLHIKSKGTAVAAATGTDPAFAVLCTADKTFHLRQVQTSNSVFIVRPTPTTLTDDDDDDGFDGDGVGLCAIATCGATLELSVSKESAAPYLLELLAEWDGVSDHIPANMPIMDWPGVRDSIPLSASELRKEWVRMCVFQHGSTCLRPTPNCLLEAWRSILETSVAEDINLADQAHVSRLWDCFSVDGSTVPKALFQAIMTRQAVNPSGGDDDQTNALSALESALWTAKILLASNGREMPRQKFLDQWMELLPDKWQAEANLANIKDFTNLSDPTMISLETDRRGNVPPPAKSAGKWHDRFKKSK